MFHHPRSGRRLAAAVASVAAATLLLSACGGGSDTAESTVPQTKVRMMLASAPNGAMADMFLAKDRGYYSAEGLDVELLPGTDSQSALTAVARGSAEIGMVSTSYAIPNAAQGNTVIAVGNRIGKHTFGLMVPQDSPIQGFTDLDGKTILTHSSQIGEELKAVIRKAGGNPDGVNLAIVAPAALLNSYAGGQGDALLTSIPFAEPVNATRPSRTVLFADHGMAIPDYAYSVRPELLEDPASVETVRKFLRASYRASGEAIADPAAAAAAFAKAVPGANAATAETQFTAMQPYSCSDSAQGQSLAAFVPADWSLAVSEFNEMGLLKGPVDASSLITDRFADTSEVACPITLGTS